MIRIYSFKYCEGGIIMAEKITHEIFSLKQSFNDYIMHFDVRYALDHQKLNVEYALLTFDLVDQDLDMDEVQYQDSCEHFKKWLNTVLVNCVNQHQIELSCVEYQPIFRNKLQRVCQCDYIPYKANKVSITKQWLQQAII